MADNGDEAPFPAMAPEGVEELSEEAMDKQCVLKQEASDAIENGKLDVALEKLTEAICLGAPSALIYCRRADILMKLDRPRAVVNDCTAALGINPDSGKAYKLRGKAFKKLEKWEEAHIDFQTGLKLDYDEDTEDAAKEVEVKAKELKAAVVKQRVAGEEKAFQDELKANKEKYEAGLRAREGEFAEQKTKEEEEKRQKEEERKQRYNAGASEPGASDGDSSGVPKSHAPGGGNFEPHDCWKEGPNTGGSAEDVD